MRRRVVLGSSGARASIACALLLVAAASCHGTEGPTEASPVAKLDLRVAQSEIYVGAMTRVSATLRDGDGNVISDRNPVWTSLTPNILSVTQQGEVTGLQSGVGQVRAASGRALSEVSITVVRQVATSITLARDTATLLLPGGSVQAIAAVADSAGNPVVQPAIAWSSSASPVASVNVAGLVTAVASGSAVISATIDGLTATLNVTVRPSPSPGAPVISSVSPALRPGSPSVLTGANFAQTTGGNLVLVDGLAATVAAASPTQLTILTPPSGFPCGPTRDAFVQVTANSLVGGGLAPLHVGNRRELQPGQSVIVTNLAEVRCNELVPAEGRWVVSVFNVSRTAVTPNATANALFAVRGIPGAQAAAQGGPAGASRAAPVPIEAGGPGIVAARPGLRDDAGASRREAAHLALLERNVALAAAAPPASARFGNPPRSSAVGTVGSLTVLKLPNLDAPDFCVSNMAVGFRTVYVGPHVAIVEDTTSLLGGKPTQRGLVDDYLTRLGDEVEGVMWPLVTGYFGNPLAMDAPLGGPGRLVIVMSPRVALMQRGSVLAFVANCDLYPASQRPSSNAGAFLYAQAPATATTGFGAPDTRDQWFRAMRSTVAHEMKHVAAFAERVSRGLPLEDISWEEGGARISEELYARRFYGNARGGNTRFAASIGCDIRYAQQGPCFARPVLMLRHFDGLYSYFSAPEINTPTGRPFADDLNFYGGAWSFLRWAADHYAVNEAQFFRDFVASPVTGIANVEARTGHTWAEMLGEWSLAAYLDDVGGFTPANPRLSMPSWNYPDIWLGMCTEMGPCDDPSNPILTYLRSTPFAPRQRSFGNFVIGYGSLIGGGFTLLDLSGPGAAS
ncbi:MAG: Ig-like domain-containing protein, partial [Gemmatimonadota bacterium]|nr:Ig-like domain-containing protein [Gemmatimonadota bacterium]